MSSDPTSAQGYALGTVSFARISTCGRYRYSLVRQWDRSNKGRCLWVMLNPSTADATSDDPTIRKCVGFAKRWGFGSIEVVNLYAWRATDPADLRAAHRRGEDVIGPVNDEWISVAIGRADQVIAAWGANAFDSARTRSVVECISDGHPVSCLGLTKKREPYHPLMISYSTKLHTFNGMDHG